MIDSQWNYQSGIKTFNVAESNFMKEEMAQVERVAFLHQKGMIDGRKPRNPILGEETHRVKKELKQRREMEKRLKTRQDFALHKSRNPLLGEETVREDFLAWKESRSNDRKAGKKKSAHDKGSGKKKSRAKQRKHKKGHKSWKKEEGHIHVDNDKSTPTNDRTRQQRTLRPRSAISRSANHTEREFHQEDKHETSAKEKLPRPTSAPSGGRRRRTSSNTLLLGTGAFSRSGNQWQPDSTPSTPAMKRPQIPVGGNWKSVGSVPKLLEDMGNKSYCKPPYATGHLGGEEHVHQDGQVGGNNASSARRRPYSATASSRRSEIFSNIDGLRDQMSMLKTQLKRVEAQMEMTQDSRNDRRRLTRDTLASTMHYQSAPNLNLKSQTTLNGFQPQSVPKFGNSKSTKDLNGSGQTPSSSSAFVRKFRKAAPTSTHNSDFKDPRDVVHKMPYKARVNYGFHNINALKGMNWNTQNQKVAITGSAREYLVT